MDARGCDQISMTRRSRNTLTTWDFRRSHLRKIQLAIPRRAPAPCPAPWPTRARGSGRLGRRISRRRGSRRSAYPVGVDETSVDLSHRATLGSREFGRRRDRFCEIRLGWIVGRGCRLDKTRATVQIFCRQIKRNCQRLNHRLRGRPQSPFYLREIRIGNPDGLGQLAHGQCRKLALLPDDRTKQALWLILIHIVRLAPASSLG